MSDVPSLNPGLGFHLQKDGEWEVKDIPSSVIPDVKYSGYLTIQGERSLVFETPSGDMWAQRVSSSRTASAWVRPILDQEMGEIERTSSELDIPVQDIVNQFGKSQLRTLSDTDWARLENTDSYEIRDLTEARDLAGIYDRDIESILQKLGDGTKMDAPVILEHDNRLYLVSGNTRLMAARSLGLKPTVLWINMDSIASKVAAMYLEAKKKSPEVLSQIREKFESDEISDWKKAALSYVKKVRKYIDTSNSDISSQIRGLEKICKKLPDPGHDRVKTYEARRVRAAYEDFLAKVTAARSELNWQLSSILRDIESDSSR